MAAVSLVAASMRRRAEARRSHRRATSALLALLAVAVMALAGAGRVFTRDGDGRLGPEDEGGAQGQARRLLAAGLDKAGKARAQQLLPLIQRPLSQQPMSCEEAIRSDTNMLEKRCLNVRKACPAEEEALIDYLQLQYCGPLGTGGTVAVLVVLVGVFFYVLGDTVDDYFCPVLQWLTEAWKLSPSTAGVTLLALGNGAPDAFSSLAAFRADGGGADAQSELADATALGLGAIISGGSFVSAFVLGAVAYTSAPFPVERLPFVRDVFFYLTASLGVFYGFVYRGFASIHTSVACLLFYALYATVVVVGERYRDDQGGEDAKTSEVGRDDAAVGQSGGKDDGPSGTGAEKIAPALLIRLLETSNAGLTPSTLFFLRDRGIAGMPLEKVLGLISSVLYLPITAFRRCTIPIGASEPSRWDRRLDAVAIAVGPMVLLVFQQFVNPSLVVARIPLATSVFDTSTSVFDPDGTIDVPLWAIILIQTSVLGYFFFHTSAKGANAVGQCPTGAVQQLLVALSFCTSIAWISLTARELLGCLRALGLAFGVSSQVLGLTVLAWGNSVGDLVADVAIARSGEPGMAVAGCYAGPMFNLLVGMGGALTLACSSSPSGRIALPMSPNVPVSFAFLFAGLVGSLVTVIVSGFRITYPWGICLMLLYLVFVIVSIVVELS